MRGIIFFLTILVFGCNKPIKRVDQKISKVDSIPNIQVRENISLAEKKDQDFEPISSMYGSSPYFQGANAIAVTVQRILEGSGNVDSLQQRLFDIFPSTFDDFLLYYGYSEQNDTIAFLPFEKSYEHLKEVFFSSDAIKEEDFVEKLVGIASTGYWQADGVNIFRHEMELKFKENIEQFLKELSLLEKERVEGFFFFLFDGPHPPEELPTYFDSIKEKYPEIYSSAMVGLEKAKTPHSLN